MLLISLVHGLVIFFDFLSYWKNRSSVCYFVTGLLSLWLWHIVFTNQAKRQRHSWKNRGRKLLLAVLVPNFFAAQQFLFHGFPTHLSYYLLLFSLYHVMYALFDSLLEWDKKDEMERLNAHHKPDHNILI